MTPEQRLRAEVRYLFGEMADKLEELLCTYGVLPDGTPWCRIKDLDTNYSVDVLADVEKALAGLYIASLKHRLKGE